MTITYCIFGVITLAVFVYLVVVLLKGEKLL